MLLPFLIHLQPKRVGRGIGSGLGKTSGRGHKGQKARAGACGLLGARLAMVAADWDCRLFSGHASWMLHIAEACI